MPGYKGLGDKAIEEYVRIAGETADTISKQITRESVFDPYMIKALDIVENEIRKRKCVIYGGTAINAIMPPELQFYDPEYDLPDWDFFTDSPIETAMDIADLVHKNAELDTAVVTAVHPGTYKVYANGQAIADITEVSKDVMKLMRKNAIIKNGVHYSGPDYLRMSAYLELSRPLGQPDRWEKVIKRVSLLNRAYPIAVPKKDERPLNKVPEERNALLKYLVSIQDTEKIRVNGSGSVFAFIGPEVLSVIRKVLSKKSDTKSGSGSKYVVTMNASEMPGGIFLLSPSPEKTAELIAKHMKSKCIIQKRDGAGEFLGEQYVVYDSKREKGRELATIVGIQEACQSIHTIRVKTEPNTIRQVRVGSIETLVYVYSSLIFASELGSVTYHELHRAIDALVKLHIRILKEQKKPLLPFAFECIGEQLTLKKMRDEKKKDLKKIMAFKGKSSAAYIRRNIRYDGGDKNARMIIERAFEREKEQLSRIKKESKD